MLRVLLPASLLVAVCLCGCERGWSFAVFGDTGIGNPESLEAAVLRRLLAEANRSGAELAFLTGDLVHGREILRARTADQYRRARDLLSILSLPLHAVPGNHDLEAPGSGEEFEALFGPTPWTFVHRGWTFLGLSTEVPGANGAITGEQEAWLESRLQEPGRRGRTVVFTHRPVWPTATFSRLYHSLPQPALHQALARAGVSATFSGHEHHYHSEVRDGVLYVITGGAGSGLLEDGYFHYVLVKVRGDKLIPQAVRLGP